MAGVWEGLPSRRMTAFHSVAISNTFLTVLPRSVAFVPSSSAWR